MMEELSDHEPLKDGQETDLNNKVTAPIASLSEFSPLAECSGEFKVEPWQFSQGKRHRKKCSLELMSVSSKSLGMDWVWVNTLKNDSFQKCSSKLDDSFFPQLSPKASQTNKHV